MRASLTSAAGGKGRVATKRKPRLCALCDLCSSNLCHAGQPHSPANHAPGHSTPHPPAPCPHKEGRGACDSGDSFSSAALRTRRASRREIQNSVPSVSSVVKKPVTCRPASHGPRIIPCVRPCLAPPPSLWGRGPGGGGFVTGNINRDDPPARPYRFLALGRRWGVCSWQCKLGRATGAPLHTRKTGPPTPPRQSTDSRHAPAIVVTLGVLTASQP